MKLPSLNSLKARASRATNFRGHKMKWEPPFAHRGGMAQTATCKCCGKWVQVTQCPAPNDIDVGGPAVAVGCSDK